jgi:hypothetical protein
VDARFEQFSHQFSGHEQSSFLEKGRAKWRRNLALASTTLGILRNLTRLRPEKKAARPWE